MLSHDRSLAILLVVLIGRGAGTGCNRLTPDSIPHIKERNASCNTMLLICLTMLYYLHRLHRAEFLIYVGQDTKEDKGNCTFLRYYPSTCLKGCGHEYCGIRTSDWIRRRGPATTVNDKPIFSWQRMLHQGLWPKMFNWKKKIGRESQGARRQDELIGGKPPVVKCNSGSLFKGCGEDNENTWIRTSGLRAKSRSGISKIWIRSPGHCISIISLLRFRRQVARNKVPSKTRYKITRYESQHVSTVVQARAHTYIVVLYCLATGILSKR
jgi:hypothetical protein